MTTHTHTAEHSKWRTHSEQRSQSQICCERGELWLSCVCAGGVRPESRAQTTNIQPAPSIIRRLCCGVRVSSNLRFDELHAHARGDAQFEYFSRDLAATHSSTLISSRVLSGMGFIRTVRALVAKSVGELIGGSGGLLWSVCEVRALIAKRFQC